MKKIIWAIVIIVIVILGVSFTQRSGKDISSTEPIYIGVIESLSGTAAFYGEKNKRGVDLALTELKEKYPELKLVVIHEDSKYNPKDAVLAYNKLKAEGKLDAVISHASPVSVAIHPLAKRDGILQMGVSGSAANYSSPNDLSVRMSPRTSLETKPMVEHLNKVGYKNVAVLYPNNDFGISVSKDFAEESTKSALKVGINEAYTPDTTDFRTVLLKIKNDKADALYIAGLATQIVTIVKQMREQNIQIPVFGPRTFEDPVLVQNLGQLAGGMIYTYGFDPEKDSSLTRSFVTKYKAQYGEDPDGYAAEGYEGMRLVGEAFAKCGKDYGCIQNFFLILKDYDSIFGKISFDENGDVTYPFYLRTIKDGKYIKYQK